jgi:hypothetical protein
VHEHILAAVFTLDEAESLLNIEKFDDTFALADDLSGHPAAGTAAAWRAEATTAAASATAKATAPRGAKAAAAARSATAEPVAASTAAESITSGIASAHEGIKAFLAEPVALVSAPAATSSIKTHNPERTFASPTAHRSATWTIRAARQDQVSECRTTLALV